MDEKSEKRLRMHGFQPTADGDWIRRDIYSGMIDRLTASQVQGKSPEEITSLTVGFATRPIG